MGGLTFQYSPWFIILCLLLGLAYALVLYFRDRQFKEQASWLNWVLGILRFLLVSLIAILLLAPFLRSLVTETKKPVVVVAQDVSESVIAGMDEEAIEQYKTDVKGIRSALDGQYEVRQYAFGESTRETEDFDFTDKVTNISEALQTVYDLYSNQNLGAVILASDGIFNEGNNPLYQAEQLSAPVFSIALGDTSIEKDVLLKRVFNNRIVYLGDQFNMEIDLSAQNCAGESSVISISRYENGRFNKLKDIPVEIDKNDFFTTEEVFLEADKSGVQRYRVAVRGVAEEASTSNNIKDIFIDVLDARQKILVIAKSPHPDISALKQSVTSNKNYEMDVIYINNRNKTLEEYDLIIFHQLPDVSNLASAFFNTVEQQKIPHIFIVGTQTMTKKLNELQSLVEIQGDGRNTNDVQASPSGNFSLFNLGQDLREELPRFPPLLAPFGDFKEGGNAQVFLYQRISKIDTKYPLFVFGEENGIKKGVLCAENIWKWRLFDFLQHQNHDLFNEFISKSIQYVSAKEDKRRFRVNLPQNIFKETDPVVFDAELYNESYELVNEPDVRLTITNSEGKEFPYMFNKSGNAYTLNAGFLSVGDYTFRSSVLFAGKELTFNGQFSIQPIQLEAYSTTANHQVLNMLSEKFGGQVFYPQNISELQEVVKNKDIKPVIYQTSETRFVINYKWLFFVLLTLLTAEWFFRRYFGAY